MKVFRQYPLLTLRVTIGFEIASSHGCSPGNHSFVDSFYSTNRICGACGEVSGGRGTYRAGLPSLLNTGKRQYITGKTTHRQEYRRPSARVTVRTLWLGQIRRLCR